MIRHARKASLRSLAANALTAISTSIVVTAISGIAVFASNHSLAVADQPTYKCNYTTDFGFYRADPSNGYRVWCANDGSITEYMGWNYYPGTAGFNNPTAGAYYNDVIWAQYYWNTRSSKFNLTYDSGYWIDNVDTFLMVDDLDAAIAPGVKGVTNHYWCTSQTSCTLYAYTDTTGYYLYNLTYITLDDNISHISGNTQYNSMVESHEFGHAMGLVHGPNKTVCPSSPTVMNYGCNGSGQALSPTARDGTDLAGMYAP